MISAGFTTNARATSRNSITSNRRSPRSYFTRRIVAARVEAALRLFDEHWRLYEYLIKRTVDPITAAACLKPVAHEAIQRRAGYLA